MLFDIPLVLDVVSLLVLLVLIFMALTIVLLEAGWIEIFLLARFKNAEVHVPSFLFIMDLVVLL
jgi:hypothetical protein